MNKLLIAMSMMLFALPTLGQQKPFTLDLWPDGAPNDNGMTYDKPEITVYLPKASKATGRAIVVCPGGGYTHLAMDHEGHHWAPFFNKLGIAAIVLKYRMPNGKVDVPQSDAYQAIRMVKAHAADWNVNPDDVGIMGFSAGGHLASTVATHAKKDVRPAFQILFYPVITMGRDFTHIGSHDNLLGKNPKKTVEVEYSSDRQVTGHTPRAFIALSDDDRVVKPVNGVNYYVECFRHDVPATLHVYPSGGHGWGFRESFLYHTEMTLDLKAWLESFEPKWSVTELK